MCDWVTLVYGRKLTEHYKPAIMKKNQYILKKQKTKQIIKKKKTEFSQLLLCSFLIS